MFILGNNNSSCFHDLPPRRSKHYTDISYKSNPPSVSGGILLSCLNSGHPSNYIQICSESMLDFISFSCSILVWISESHRCTHTICNCNMAILTSFLTPKQYISFFRIIERSFYYFLPLRIEWTSCYPSIPCISSEWFNWITTFLAVYFCISYTFRSFHSWFYVILTNPFIHHFFVSHS